MGSCKGSVGEATHGALDVGPVHLHAERCTCLYYYDLKSPDTGLCGGWEEKYILQHLIKTLADNSITINITE